MHAARRTSERLGCHHGKTSAESPPPVNDGACAMRSACGHRGEAIVVTFHAELPPAVIVGPRVATPFVPLPERPLLVADGPAPPDHPPESLVV